MWGDCCCSGDCNDNGHGVRKVLTKSERIVKLKNYSEELKKELTAVEENIKVLNK